MDWKNLPSGGNIEDRRGGGGGRVAVGGGLGLLIALAAAFFGVDPSAILGGVSNTNSSAMQQSQPAGTSNQATRDTEYDFIDRTLASTDQVWIQVFSRNSRRYNKPRLVLFSGATRSSCGNASSATGPFYCPVDRKVYLDTSFFKTMQQRLGGGGDFAYAYVIAHEVAHHVQNELGILEQVQRAQQRSSKTRANQLNVALELQADCFAGLWGHYVKDLAKLTRADLQEAVNTAEAIGDDALQRASQGYVVPDSFTHGSSQQRIEWFMRGFRSGNVQTCNTFS